MINEDNKKIIADFMERAFNRGDLDAIEAYVSPQGIDHQEADGAAIIPHLREVVTGLRTAFPDLNFNIHALVSEEGTVAFRSTMTGTHQGTFQLGCSPVIPASGRKVEVSHMHFVRIEEGKAMDLWHVWDVLTMLRQIGAMPGAAARAA